MAAFLLVHGSCHGAWCWREVIPALEALGHTARAIDLPAHGEDRTAPAAATLDGYVEAIIAAIDAPVTLVAHSAAGYPATLAAGRAPGRIRRLVYLSAYVPAPGLSLVDMRRAGPRQPLRGVMRADPGGVTYTADPQKAAAVFYHDCPPEAVAFALPRLCPEPIRPQSTPLPAGATVPAIDCHYILCEDDRTIPPEYQAEMARPLPSCTLHRLVSGHSPFFSMPTALAGLLDAIARG
ncbi:alpha/beta fold hydrolase [Albidovulum sp.]|jgi:pimeloyl-ACP methyl ester carboxylesterase|uniref:alpha/beta fold hydrolase n=1 Tax=Albidovulum sp. TaxID=1872424 RepID=UPI003059E3FF